MSDTTIRGLERKWQQSGAVQDEVELLRARLRAADVTQPRLELAAYCGHPGAHAIVGSQAKYACACRGQDLTHGHAAWAGPGFVQNVPLQAWLEGLEHWGIPIMARAAVAAARSVLPLHEVPRDGSRAWGSRYGPRTAVESVETWLRCPCLEHAEICHRLALGFGTLPAADHWWAHTLAIPYSAPDIHWCGVSLRLAVESADTWKTEPAMRRQVEAALIGWALSPREEES